MNAIWTSRQTHPGQSGFKFWWFLVGVLVGLLFLLAMQLKLKWFAFLFLGSVVFLASLAAPRKKEYFLVLLVLALPVWVGKHFYFHPNPYGISTFGFPVHASFLPLAALYVIWVVRQGAAPLAIRGLLPLAGVLGAAAVSVLAAQDKLLGAFDLFALATSMLIFIYAASEIREPREWRLVLGLLVASAALHGTLAEFQYLTGSNLGLGPAKKLYGYAGLEVVSRVGGLIGHPNALALFFDLMLPLSVSLLFCPMRSRTRFFLTVAILLQVGGLGVTYSRGGIIGSGLAILFLSVFHGARRFGLMRAVFLTAAGTLLLATFLAVVPNPITKGLTRTEETAYGRWPLAKVAFTMIRHHPLFGVGFNNFTRTARSYDFTPEQIIAAWNSPVHNLFLFIGGEIGLVGLICFLGFIGQATLGLLPAMRAPDPFIRSVGSGLFFGLVAFLIHTQVDYGIWTQNRPLWFFLGLAMGMGALARSAPATSAPGFR